MKDRDLLEQIKKLKNQIRALKSINRQLAEEVNCGRKGIDHFRQANKELRQMCENFFNRIREIQKGSTLLPSEKIVITVD
ncbi:MAG: hypothetical protein GY710_02810 [Desulfobacteraceae bacterium]|nr:hypothetical protein [Desulfobacteraceae bacterium]